MCSLPTSIWKAQLEQLLRLVRIVYRMKTKTFETRVIQWHTSTSIEKQEQEDSDPTEMWSDLSQRQTEFPLGFKVSRHRDILKPNWSIRRNNPNGWRREEQSWNQQTHELLSANGTRESNQRTMEMKTFDLSMNNWKQSDWSGMSRCVRSSVDCFQRNFNYFPLSSLINRANTRLKNVRTVDGKILIFNRKLMWKIRKINWKTFTPVLFPSMTPLLNFPTSPHESISFKFKFAIMFALSIPSAAKMSLASSRLSQLQAGSIRASAHNFVHRLTISSAHLTSLISSLFASRTRKRYFYVLVNAATLPAFRFLSGARLSTSN